MIKLFVLDGEHLGKSILLRENQEIVIGRENCEFQIPSEGVSRQHCKARLINGVVYLQDLDSRNGTYINKQPISTITPLEKDHIACIGDTRVLLKEIAENEPTRDVETNDIMVLHQKKRTSSTFFMNTNNSVALKYNKNSSLTNK